MKLSFSFYVLRQQPAWSMNRTADAGNSMLSHTHISRREWGNNWGFSAHWIASISRTIFSWFLFDKVIRWPQHFLPLSVRRPICKTTNEYRMNWAVSCWFLKIRLLDGHRTRCLKEKETTAEHKKREDHKETFSVREWVVKTQHYIKKQEDQRETHSQSLKSISI